MKLVFVLSFVFVVSAQITFGSIGTQALPNARTGYVSISNSGLSFFAGGQINDTESGIIDIFDKNSLQWKAVNLSLARHDIAAVSVSKKVYFIGGAYNPVNFTSIVDIYDIDTGIFTKFELPRVRSKIDAASVKNLIFLTGNFGNDSVLIWDTTTNAITTRKLINNAGFVTPVTVKDLVLFPTSQNNVTSIDVYDSNTQVWSTTSYKTVGTTLTFTPMKDYLLITDYFATSGILYDYTQRRFSDQTVKEWLGKTSTSLGNTAFFFQTSTTYIFDATKKTWNEINLSQSLIQTATANDPLVLVAGKFNVNIYSNELCQPGTFSTTGFGPCNKCAPGSVSATTGSKKCTTCVANKEPDTAQTQCVECGLGYCAKSGDVACYPCQEASANGFFLTISMMIVALLCL